MLEAEARELRNERDRILIERQSAPTTPKLTSLKRLDDSEVAEIHARDQKRRIELGSLSVVAEDAEMPSLTSTVETIESASDDMLDSAEALPLAHQLAKAGRAKRLSMPVRSALAKVSGQS